MLTVPAFQSLWGLQDEIAHHKRRYVKNELVEVVKRAGLMPVRDFYFNYLLFAPIYAARKLMLAAGVKVASESRVNTPLLNQILSAIFRADIATAPAIRPPFGVSAFVLARKPGDARVPRPTREE